jgi:hypothetical protein
VYDRVGALKDTFFSSFLLLTKFPPIGTGTSCNKYILTSASVGHFCSNQIKSNHTILSQDKEIMLRLHIKSRFRFPLMRLARRK